MLGRLMTICKVFWRIDDSGLKNLQEWYGRKIYAGRIAVNRWFFTARPALNMPCQNKEGRTEVMPSIAARGYTKLGVISCRGASWSEQLDGK